MSEPENTQSDEAFKTSTNEKLDKENSAKTTDNEKSNKENGAVVESAQNSCKRRSYDVGFKLSVVAFAEKASNRAAGRKYGIDEKRIREWRSLKSTFELDPRSKRKRLSGGGRKPLLPKETERELSEWVEELLENSQGVEHRLIVEESRKLALELNSQSSFIASKSWLDNFLRRHGFLSKRNVVIQRLPTSQRWQPYPPDPSFPEIVAAIRNLQREKRFPFRTMGGVEEVVLCVQNNATPTRAVPICMTVALGCSSDGRKYLPFVVFPEGDMPCLANKATGVVVKFSHDGQMTDELVATWVSDLWWGGHTDRKSILIWDSCTSTKIEASLKLAASQGTNLFFLPHEVTSSLHPSISSWGSLFKDHFDKLHFSHLMNNKGSLRDKVLKWIRQAWDSISEEFVLQCLRARGIAFVDSDLHCDIPQNSENIADDFPDDHLCVRGVATDDGPGVHHVASRVNAGVQHIASEGGADMGHDSTHVDSEVRQDPPNTDPGDTKVPSDSEVQETGSGVQQVTTQGSSILQDASVLGVKKEATHDDARNTTSDENSARISGLPQTRTIVSLVDTSIKMDTDLSAMAPAYCSATDSLIESNHAIVELQDCVHEVVIRLASDAAVNTT